MMPPIRCTRACISSCHRACCSAVRLRVIARAVRVHSHRTSHCLWRCRPTCRRPASNTAGLRPLPCSPGRWLPAQQRHRAAVAGSENRGGQGRQMRKARLKGAAPRCAQSQSARGLGAARARVRLRSASGLTALRTLGLPCAASAQARWAWLEPHHESARKFQW